MSFLVGTLLLAVVTALACALPGVFVVLRGSAMLVDGISHAVLPGIVVGYLVTREMDSPLLIVGAAGAGLLVALGSEWLSRSGLLRGDAAQGLVFPALFSVGVILLSLRFSNLHLDTHAVLVGDLNLAAWRQLVVGGVSLGPVYLYVMLGVLLVNVVFLCGLFPRLQLVTFDSGFARSVGVRVGLLNTVFMFLVAVTVTAAFNAVGAILVLALVVVPAAAAVVVCSRLGAVFVFAGVFSVVGTVLGFWLAYVFDAATSAGVAVFYGLLFAVVLCVCRIWNMFCRGVDVV